MTDLLTPVSSRLTGRPGKDPSSDEGRPLALSAVVVGLGGPAVALALLWFVGLVGWYAADGGSHGTTTSVLRVGADAWLLAHGSPLSVHQVAITASPLGVTLLCGWITYRLAKRAAAASVAEDLRAVGLSTVVVAGCYAAVALLTAVLAGRPGAEPGLGAAFLGGAFVGGVAGGAGLLRGSGRAGELRLLIPVRALSMGYAALTSLLLMVGVGALLTAAGLVAHWSAAAEIVDTLDLDLTGGLLSLVLLVAIAPNVVLLAATYVLGSGFAVGAGTVVSPAEVTLGPVPSVPVLAALPDNGWAPGWAMALVAVPVLVAAVAALLTGRALPTSSYQSAAVRGLGGGVISAALLTVAASFAGGSIGPGRMADLGVSAGETFLAALLPLGIGAVLGAVVAAWWTRRHDIPDAQHPQPQPRSASSQEETAPVPTLQPAQPRADLASDLADEETVTLRLPDQRKRDDRPAR
jgi:hypothetical protein